MTLDYIRTFSYKTFYTAYDKYVEVEIVKEKENDFICIRLLELQNFSISFFFFNLLGYVILFVVILLLCYMLAFLLILPLMGKVSDQFLIGVKAIL